MYLENIKKMCLQDVITCLIIAWLNYNLQILNFDAERNESLNLKGETLGAAECETLEEILKRVQFVTINLEGTGVDDEVSLILLL